MDINFPTAAGLQGQSLDTREELLDPGTWQTARTWGPGYEDRISGTVCNRGTSIAHNIPWPTKGPKPYNPRLYWIKYENLARQNPSVV